ncbi:uncharacterized protein B0I36DRAFT_296087 [Microdochium trichocladiopsis]|uniref:Tyrosinase copper-binding domain-containing protein n=1 Tax=Microdochium trichocladiopsis TaxID=1682393 RepID=A0A9P8XUJ5_9PEZI|nr:uncharacterized protein B0I36DRAFT_296087 [Microdochium trichocladiopsis]KAH7020701.1 hypothetical protein B0I36DRAFT_296087 [Microdochium trichocladiopsis]
MHFLSLQSTLLLLTTAIALPCVSAAPQAVDSVTSDSASTSGGLLVRKEWRKLPKSDRLAYIQAIKCLQSKPGKTGGAYDGVRSRYDDFLAMHIIQTDFVHFNGQFLAWHRWLLQLWQQDLKNTCGFKGAIPYWDFTLDNTQAGFPKSPVFDNTYGFGGNGEFIADISDPVLFPVKTPTIMPGRTGGGCIDKGPFAGLVGNMGLGLNTSFSPNCVRRDFDPLFVSLTISPANVKTMWNAKTYDEFSVAIQGRSFDVAGLTIHAGLHLGIGGQVGDASDMYSSPADPLFYMIHGALDWAWDKWQRADWNKRKNAIGGPDVNFAYPFNFFGDIPYKNVTLDTPLDYPFFGKSIKIRDVMDTAALGYRYE